MLASHVCKSLRISYAVRVTVMEFGLLIKARRKELGLDYQGIASLGGPSSPTMLSIEAGRKKAFRPSTFRNLDAVLDWPPGHAKRRYDELTDNGRAVLNPAGGRSRIEDLRRAYLALRDADAPPAAIAAAAELLAYALVPHILVRLQQLQLDDLYGLDTDDVLTLDEILDANNSPQESEEVDDDGKPTSSQSVREGDNSSRTVARLADGRVISIKALRIEQGLSQTDVVKAITRQRLSRDPQAKAMTVGTLSGIESGYRGASPTLTRELEFAYKLTRGAITKQW